MLLLALLYHCTSNALGTRSCTRGVYGKTASGTELCCDPRCAICGARGCSKQGLIDGQRSALYCCEWGILTLRRRQASFLGETLSHASRFCRNETDSACVMRSGTHVNIIEERMYDSSPATALFLSDCSRLPAGAHVELFEVGANNGRYCTSISRALARVARRISVNLTMIEPQLRYQTQLEEVVASVHRLPNMEAHHLAAMASSHDGNTTLYRSRNTFAASSVASMATRFGTLDKYTVDAVDLSRLLHQSAARIRRHRAGGLLFVKMDVEGGEAQLLPWLLVTGALCHARYLRIEWHLNGLPPKQRLGALALKLGLHDLLSKGCPTAAGAPAEVNGTIIVEHEEYRSINFGEEVPGLLDEAVRHIPGTNATGRLHKKLGVNYTVQLHKLTRKANIIFTTYGRDGKLGKEVFVETSRSSNLLFNLDA